METMRRGCRDRIGCFEEVVFVSTSFRFHSVVVLSLLSDCSAWGLELQADCTSARQALKRIERRFCQDAGLLRQSDKPEQELLPQSHLFCSSTGPKENSTMEPRVLAI